MIEKILSLLIHLGPLKGWKTVIGAVLSQLLLLGVIPAPWLPVVQFLAAWLTTQGVVSKAADKTGALPAKREIAWKD